MSGWILVTIFGDKLSGTRTGLAFVAQEAFFLKTSQTKNKKKKKKKIKTKCIVAGTKKMNSERQSEILLLFFIRFF